MGHEHKHEHNQEEDHIHEHEHTNGMEHTHQHGHTDEKEHNHQHELTQGEEHIHDHVHTNGEETIHEHGHTYGEKHNHGEDHFHKNKDWEKEWNKKYDEPSFKVIADHDDYQERSYPAATWACTSLEVDTAEDPLAGLENVNFLDIMKTKRYKTKVPSSLMFWPLFRYIGGNNDGEV